MSPPISSAELDAWVRAKADTLRAAGAWLSGLDQDPEAWAKRGVPELFFTLIDEDACRALLLGAWAIMEQVARESGPADPLTLAQRALAIEWLSNVSDSEPALIGAPQAPYAMPDEVRLMMADGGGEFAYPEDGMRLMLAEDDEERAALEASAERQVRAANTREHAGRFLHTCDPEFWPGERYTWPQVIAQTWGVANDSVFNLLDELGDASPGS